MNKKLLMHECFILYPNVKTVDKAIECFKQVMTLDPYDVNAYFWLAYSLWEYSAQWEEAKKVAEQGIALSPDRADLHLVLAWNIERLQGPTSEYEAELRKAIELEPEWITPRACLIDYLMNKGRKEEALQEIKEAIKKFPKEEITIPTNQIEWQYQYFITGIISESWKQFILDQQTKLMASD